MADLANASARKQGTRVFKKCSPNGKITTYLCKRDFIDSLTHVDPIEGVVLVDPEYVRGRKVFTHVLSAFRYGREDLDVLGLTFRKDLYLASAQVYPPIYSNEEDDRSKILLNPGTTIATSASRLDSHTIHDFECNDNRECRLDSNTLPLTKLQERLIKKLGPNAFPFYFKLPPDAPASVTLQPGLNETGKPCGVDYELRTYVAESRDDKLQKRNSVRLAIRKLTYAPEEPAPQPSAVVFKEFIMSPGTLRLEVSLDKEKYYHGESIEVNVLVDNNSNKTVKKIKLSVRQYTQLCLHNNNRYSCVVDSLETDESFPILPSQTGWCKVYRLCPLLSKNRHKRGLALDGKLKHEDTNLASSTIICNTKQKENLGMTVQYRVKVRLVLGFVSSDICLELPFTLTHPKPDLNESKFIYTDDVFTLSPVAPNTIALDSVTNQNFSRDKFVPLPGQQQQSHYEQLIMPSVLNNLNEPRDQNNVSTNEEDLINLHAGSPTFCDNTISKSNNDFGDDDDDLIFEDFARLRLKGYDSSSSNNVISDPQQQQQEQQEQITTTSVPPVTLSF